MLCACAGGHGVECRNYAPYCPQCGENLAGRHDLHLCAADRYCAGCGVQVAGQGVGMRAHNICSGYTEEAK